MNCETVRQIIDQGNGGEWSRDLQSHLTECEACLDIAIDQALRQPPTSQPPDGFARRLETRILVTAGGRRRERVRGLHIAAGTLVVLGVAVTFCFPERDLIPAVLDAPSRGSLALAALGGLELAAVIAWTARDSLNRLYPRAR